MPVYTLRIPEEMNIVSYNPVQAGKTKEASIGKVAEKGLEL